MWQSAANKALATIQFLESKDSQFQNLEPLLISQHWLNHSMRHFDNEVTYGTQMWELVSYFIGYDIPNPSQNEKCQMLFQFSSNLANMKYDQTLVFHPLSKRTKRPIKVIAFWHLPTDIVMIVKREKKNLNQLNLVTIYRGIQNLKILNTIDDWVCGVNNLPFKLVTQLPHYHFEKSFDHSSFNHFHPIYNESRVEPDTKFTNIIQVFPELSGFDLKIPIANPNLILYQNKQLALLKSRSIHQFDENSELYFLDIGGDQYLRTRPKNLLTKQKICCIIFCSKTKKVYSTARTRNRFEIRSIDGKQSHQFNPDDKMLFAIDEKTRQLGIFDIKKARFTSSFVFADNVQQEIGDVIPVTL
ncbi:MAG: hypothetical protein ACRCXZ_07660 [Patescibacteria group bacterium]